MKRISTAASIFHSHELRTYKLTHSQNFRVRVLFALAFAIAVTAFSVNINAATFVVDTIADTQDAAPGNGICADSGGACSLRAAITEANALAGADVITVPAGSYTEGLVAANENVNAGGDFDITSPMTINGAGAAATVIQSNATSNTAAERVFHVLSGGTAVTINGVTIQNGKALNASDGGRGAGIKAGENSAGDSAINLTITNSTIQNNFAEGRGGGLAVNKGNLTVTGCTFTGNVAGSDVGNGGSGGAMFIDSQDNAPVAGQTATVTNTVMNNNKAESSVTNTFGGAVIVRALNATATFNGCTINNNQSNATTTASFSGFGGGLYNQQAHMIVMNSTVNGNTSSHFHPGIRNLASTSAAATIDITYSTISNNTCASDSAQGGGIMNILASSFGATVNVDHSTISGNTLTGATSLGGGLANTGSSGGAAVLNITNSTISGNSAHDIGGIYSDGSAATCRINFSTVVNNQADPAVGQGGGIFQDATAGGSTFVSNSISANNIASLDVDINDLATSQNYNHIKNPSANFVTAANDVTGTDPLLGALANNGGPTLTHFPGLPVRDLIPTGTNGCGSPISNDQRGGLRPTGAGCDKGSVELDGPSPTATSTPSASPSPTNTATASPSPTYTATPNTRPNVTTLPPTFPGLFSTQLNGSANPNGLSTTGWLRYSTTNPGSCNDSFGNRTPLSGVSLGAGTSLQTYAGTFDEGFPGVTYYYCAVAQNANGFGFGAVLSVQAPTSPLAVTSPATAVTGNAATLNGSVNPRNNSAFGHFRISTANPGTCNDSFGTRVPSSSASDASLGVSAGPVPYSFDVTGLPAGTTYYYCAIGNNSIGTSFGVVVSFVTAGPTVTSTPTPLFTPTATLSPTPAVIAFSSATFSEDESQIAYISIERTGNISGTNTVYVSTVAGGTATGGGACGPGVDYITVSNQQVTLDRFVSGTTIPVVTICPDSVVDPNETVNLSLTGSNVGSPSSAVLTINDTAAMFVNSASLAISGGGNAFSSITVSQGPTIIGSMRLTIYDYTNVPFPDNMDVMLVGPNNSRFILMANTGGFTTPQTSVTLNFSDVAGQLLPDNSGLTTGTFEPTSYGSTLPNFPAPAPPGPYNYPGSAVGGTGTQTLAGNFAGSDANGVWTLYLRDRTVGGNGGGYILGGWGLELVSAVSTMTPTPSPTPAECAGDTWTSTSTSTAATRRYGHGAVWTGTEMVIWGGFEGLGTSFFRVTNTGAKYNPFTNTWTPMTIVNLPSARENFTTVWTGTEMIVWGGDDHNGVFYNTGGRYNPATNTWTPMSTLNAPDPRANPRSVWTGTEMLVWGGSLDVGQFNTGGRYNPATDSWTPISTTNAPSARSGHTTVWTGTEMIVWGGNASGSYLNTGGRYNPVTDAWTSTNTTGTPTGRFGHTAIWTGSEMIVWGGFDNAIAGGMYNPNTNSWTSISTVGQPTERLNHTAIWTGSEMIVWGGNALFSGTQTNTGGRYVRSTNTWTSTSVSGAPASRHSHTAVWTGSQMIIWGGLTEGSGGSNALDTGGKYCTQGPIPTATNTSTPSATNTPSNTPTASTTPTPCGSPSSWVYKAYYPQLVDSAGVTSDGNFIYVFGGRNTPTTYNLVNRYNPSLDLWTPLAPMPAADYGVAAEYGGNGKIYVMGGNNLPTANRIYNIASGTWTTGSPLPAVRRGFAHAFYEGKIYVIGGSPSSSGATTSVYAYIIDEDSWQTLAPLPAARSNSVAVAINGRLYATDGYGAGFTGPYSNLYVYDIATNTWTSGASAPYSTGGAASTVVGGKFWLLGSGGGVNTQIYDPDNDSWSLGPLFNRFWRTNLGAATVGTTGQETAYVVGGFDSGPITAINEVESNTVVLCPPTPTATASPSPTNSSTATNTPTPPAAITGTVTYGNAEGAATPRLISDVLISSSVGSPPVAALTDVLGAYLLSGFGSGAYTIEPSKEDDFTGAVTAFDAALIARHVSGSTRLTGSALAVADVSGNGIVNSFDAARVAQFATSLPPGSLAGSWRFIPASRTYPSISSDITGEDYSALLMGDVSGNWGNNGRPAGRSGRGLPVADSTQVPNIVVDLPTMTAKAGPITVPVNVKGVVDKGILAYEFDLRYDPAVIRPLEDSADLPGTASRGLMAATNLIEPGLLRLVVYGPIAIDEDGILLNLRFTAIGKPGSVTPLSFERIIFNEDEFEMITVEGQVHLF